MFLFFLFDECRYSINVCGRSSRRLAQVFRRDLSPYCRVDCLFLSWHCVAPLETRLRDGIMCECRIYYTTYCRTCVFCKIVTSLLQIAVHVVSNNMRQLFCVKITFNKYNQHFTFFVVARNWLCRELFLPATFALYCLACFFFAVKL